MKQQYFLAVLTLILPVAITAQTDSFDIATFNAPKGWQRADSNGVALLQNYRTQNNLTSFCQILIFPSRATKSNAVKNFEEEWKLRVVNPTGSKVKPATSTEKTPDGWTAVTGAANITNKGITYTCMLVAVTGFDKQMSILVNLAGQDYVAEVEKFLSSFELDSKATARTGNPNIQQMNSGTFDWNNYAFVAPDNWFTTRNKDFIQLAQSQTEQGCVITILSPQASSGNLETDAKAVFDMMYPGWKYRYTGEKQYDISKGYTQQGLEYCMFDAPMHKMRPDGYYYDYEDGSAWVIRMGNQVAIIAGRHNRLIACNCYHYYHNWRRFFNSFTVKNQTAQNTSGQDLSKRIIGSWMQMGSGALTEYIFAANGHYQFIGAYGTSSNVTRNYTEYVEIKSSAWEGDGIYSMKGNKIILTGRGDNNKEEITFRFEKVNHGGTGWKERLCMLKIFRADGKPYEVCYEKSR